MREKINFQELNQEHLERGLNIGIHSYYFRHAEKASGDVVKNGEISRSALSGVGKFESIILGQQIPGSKDGYKIAHSEQERTLETGNYMTMSRKEKRFFDRKNLDLSVDQSPKIKSRENYKKFIELYLEKWKNNKKKILENSESPVDNYDSLTTTKQAEISEWAEESVIEEWLNNPNSDLATLLSSEDAARMMAPIVNRDLKMVKRLNSDSQIDLLRITHKTKLEPLLMKILILENGKHPKSISDFGGSFGLNEGIEFEIKTDEVGKLSHKLVIYRVDRNREKPIYTKSQYKIDVNELEKLSRNME